MNLVDELRIFVDAHGLSPIINALSVICEIRSQSAAENGNKQGYKDWNEATKSLKKMYLKYINGVTKNGN